MNDLLTEMPSACLAPVVELIGTLDALSIVPAGINVEWQYTTRTQPYINVWIRYRTEFEALTTALGLKTVNKVPTTGQRHYYTTSDKAPLIQCMSFEHHDDWQATT